MAQPFTISITFSELCMFAADKTASDCRDRLHVLLMRSDLSNCMERHVPRLLYDDGYLTKPSSNKTRKLSGNLTCTALENCALCFEEGTTPLALDSLPPEVASLDLLASVGPMKRKYVNESARAIASAKVTLFTGHAGEQGSGGTFSGTLRNGSPWSGQLTDWLEWVIPGVCTDDGKNACLDIGFTPMWPGGNVADAVRLYPIDDIIELVIINVEEDIPSDGACPPAMDGGGITAAHFPVFFRPFENENPDPPVHAPILTLTSNPKDFPPPPPVLVGKTGGCGVPVPATKKAKPNLKQQVSPGKPTCIMAQVTTV